MSEDDAILAGELALGVLDSEERAAALRRVLAEPAFAALVARWRDHLASLYGEVAPVLPSPAVERRVIAGIAAPGAGIRRWRAVAAGTSVVAASLLAVLVLRPMPAPSASVSPPRVMVAALAAATPTAGKPVSAVYHPDSGVVVLIDPVAPPADRSAELWLILPGAKPRPLGLVGPGGRASVRVAAAARPAMVAEATLAISIEPAGGSPTGQPTGPVVAAGVLAAT